MEDAKRRKLNEANDTTVDATADTVAATAKQGDDPIEHSTEGSTVDDVIKAVSEAAAAEAAKDEEAGTIVQNSSQPGQSPEPSSAKAARKGKICDGATL